MSVASAVMVLYCLVEPPEETGWYYLKNEELPLEMKRQRGKVSLQCSDTYYCHSLSAKWT